MSVPQYSIIVPVYNIPEELLKNCLNALENIDVPENSTYEIIAVDDGSTATVAGILDELEKKSSHMKVIHIKNSGVSVARNIGISIARGKWLLFVDADDCVESDFLTTFARMEKENPAADIFVAGYYTVSENKKVAQTFIPPNILKIEKNDPQVIRNMILSTWNNQRIADTNIGVPWAKMYRAEFFERYQLKFVPGLRRMQDMVLNLWAFYYAETIICSAHPIYCYSVWGGSAVSRYSPNYQETAKTILEQIQTYLHTTGQWKALQHLYYAKGVQLLFEIYRLGCCHVQCELTYAGKIKEMETIAKDSIFNKAIMCASSNDLTRFQRIKWILVKYRRWRSLYWLLWLQNRLR